MHDLPLITTLALAFGAAWALGLMTQKLGLSPIVGYLLAGVLIGPHTPGFEGDIEIAHQLAEVGVILLMFGVGLHFHLKDLLAVKNVAIPGAIVQSAVATLCGLVIFSMLGFETKPAMVMGMAMAVASTVVLMRVLIDADMLSSGPGHVAVGWLLVEDIFTVVLLVLIPILGKGAGPAGEAAAGGLEAEAMGLGAALALALVKLAVLMGVMAVAGKRIIPWALVQVARLRSRELFTLTVLVFSISIAAASYALFGASMALGAFLAGMVVAQSPVSAQAAADALPLRDAFAVIFFVSVGMIFNPAIVIDQPLMLLAALAIILIAKPLAALAIVMILGHSVRTALTVMLGLAQIGEFSFILSEMARANNLMPDDGHNVLVASAIISITINPLLFRMLEPIERWLHARPKLWIALNGRAERAARRENLDTETRVNEHAATGARPAIVVGFGPVGRSVHRLLEEAGVMTVVIDTNMDTVMELKDRGIPAVFGDATHETVLSQAGAARASHLVLTLPHSAARLAVVTAARAMNPTARILVRAHYLREHEDLEQAGATSAVFEEAEVAVALARLVLADTGADRDVAERKVRDLRLQLILENMTNIRSQRLRTIMIPWTRVRRISNSANRREALRIFAKQRFSRCPVTDSKTGKVVGYLLAKDLFLDRADDDDWQKLIRPLRVVRPDDDIESTLLEIQNEGAGLCIVEDAGSPVGLITLEDILAQVIGRIEDEYPHEPAHTLRESIVAGGMVLDLNGRTADEIIGELAGRLSQEKLPEGVNVTELALAREKEISTDLGVGVAIPHARVPNLENALVVFGRSHEGVIFSPQTDELVHLVFLLVTPLEQPHLQITLLAQLAAIAGKPDARQRLREATSDGEIMKVLNEE